MSAQLDLHALGKSFDGLPVIENVSFSAKEGAITGLMGPNGAGKTVLIDLITGQLAADEGHIRLALPESDGLHELTGLPPDAIAAIGVARTWADTRMLGTMSVLDEVIIGAYSHRDVSLLASVLGLPAARHRMAEVAERARGLLGLVGLADRAQSRAENLTRADRMRVGIARALAADPALLLLDGPANGLDAGDIAETADLIHLLRDAGITILLAERNMKLIADCCDHVVALDAGTVIAEGMPQECFAHPAVQRAYFGATTSC